MSLSSRLNRLERQNPPTGAAWCACDPVAIYDPAKGYEQAAAMLQGTVCLLCGLPRDPDRAEILLPDNGRGD